MTKDLSFELLKARVDAYGDAPGPAEVKVSVGELRRLIEDLEKMYQEMAGLGRESPH